MGKADHFDTFDSLNELFSRLGRKDSEVAEHAKHALEFFRREGAANPNESSWERYVERLADLHLGEAGERDFALAHWHVPSTEVMSPLWIRQRIVSEMKKLAGRRAALLLITGLREAVCPQGRNWTKNRAQQYMRVQAWIDDLACAWASNGSQLQVIVL